MNTTTNTPKLEDVARLAGVSTATVSRCLNDPSKVAESTRKKVSEAVAALGYSPNFGARVMAARRTMTIGAIIPTMENAIFARGLQAFQERLHEKGYHLLVASSSYSPEREADEIRALVARGAEGLLLIGEGRPEEISSFLRQRGIPTLLAWVYDANALFATVGFDNKAPMQDLARIVLSKGHRVLGMISAETRHNDRARARVDGVRAAMREAGLADAALSLVETPYGIDTGADAFETLMARTPRPTAVFCGNDVLAVGALKRAKEMGLAVPDDVSITGFDDIELASVVDPALTTVHVPHRAMGQAAADALVAMIERPSAAHEGKRLEAHVLERQSLGAI